jgi:hypothetical protein
VPPGQVESSDGEVSEGGKAAAADNDAHGSVGQFLAHPAPFGGDGPLDALFDVAVTMPVVGPQVGGGSPLRARGRRTRRGLADQAAERAVGVADRLGGAAVVAVGRQGEQGHLVQRAQRGPDLPQRDPVHHGGIGVRRWLGCPVDVEVGRAVDATARTASPGLQTCTQNSRGHCR